MSLADLLTRPIAYHPALARLLGSVPAAVMLSQAIYWQQRVPGGARPHGCPGEGWWWHTIEEWEEETALSRDVQHTARRRLVGMGILHERRAGQPARMWYRVDMEALERLWAGKNQKNRQSAAIPQTRLRDCRGLVCGDPVDLFAATPQTSKSTSESTSKTTTTTPTPPLGGGGSGDSTEMEEYIHLAAQEYCRARDFGPEKLAGAVTSIRRRLAAQGGDMTDLDRQQLAGLRARQMEVQAMRERMAAQAEEPPRAEIIHLPRPLAEDEPAVWRQAREHLRASLPVGTYSLWIEPLVCGDQEGNTLLLAGPDRFFCAWVANNYLPEIEAALLAAGLSGAKVRLMVADSSVEMQR